MIKKIALVMLIGIIAVSVLAGCGNKNAKQNTIPENSTENQDTIGKEKEDTEKQNTEEKEESAIEGVRLLDIGYTDYSEWRNGDVGISVSYQVPTLSTEEAKNYPELQKAFDEFGIEKARQTKEIKEDLVQLLAEDSLYSDMEYIDAYSDERKMSILRADSNAVGLYINYSGYSGGAHGYYGHMGVAFDTKTGKVLDMKDVVTDTSVFFDMVLEKLKVQYEDVYNDLWDPVAYMEELKENPEISWSLSNEGVTVYFNPYEIAAYAFGAQIITVYFDEAPEIFNPKYMEVADEYVMPVMLDEPMSIKTNDGRKDLLIESTPYWEAEYDYISHYDFTISFGDKTLSINDYGYNGSGVVVYSHDKYYLYFSESMEGDEYGNYFIDLDTMTYDKNARMYGRFEKNGYYSEEIEEGYKYENVIYPFVNPSDFYFTERMEVFGTYSGSKKYYVGDDGIPVSDEERYVANLDFVLKVKMPVNAEVIDETGKRVDMEIIPEGTYLKIFFSDGKKYADVQIIDEKDIEDLGEGDFKYYIAPDTKYDASKKAYRIYMDNYDYPRTINGVPEEDVFAGIMYAG